MKWIVAVALVFACVSLAYARHLSWIGGAGMGPFGYSGAGVPGTPSAPLTPCGALQTDFSVTTGCNAAAIVLLH
jgi:hypothetical protein